MIVEIVLLVVALLGVFEYITKYTRVGKHIDKIPGPTGWPLIGNVPELFKNPGQFFSVLSKWAVEYYPIYKCWTTHKAFVVILHPDDIEKLLGSTKYLEKSIFYDPLRGWMKDGLLVTGGAKWHKRRKMLTAAFHFNVLRQYFGSMVEHGLTTMNTLKSNGETICNVSELVSDFTLDVICETAMGVQSFDKEFSRKYREAVHNIGSCFIYRITNPWFSSETLFRLSPKGKEYITSLKVSHDYTKKILKDRKEYHKMTNNQFLNEFSEDKSKHTSTNDDVYDGCRKKRLAMLDLLIAEQNQGRIDDKGIMEELDTFTFGGHDTSAMALSYAIWLLAEHEDVQARIREEVSQVLDANGGKLGISEVQSFSYLEMCLKESLRLYPIAPYFSREITEDLQLTNHRIPKGAIAMITPYSVHRVPEFWPDPEKFDPDRFLPENASKRHPYSYIPFSAGPRNCIGQKFAMLELKVFMSLLVYNFILIPASTTRKLSFTSDIVLRSTEPIRVKLLPIKKS